MLGTESRTASKMRHAWTFSRFPLQSSQINMTCTWLRFFFKAVQEINNGQVLISVLLITRFQNDTELPSAFLARSRINTGSVKPSASLSESWPLWCLNDCTHFCTLLLLTGAWALEPSLCTSTCFPHSALLLPEVNIKLRVTLIRRKVIALHQGVLYTGTLSHTHKKLLSR